MRVNNKLPHAMPYHLRNKVGKLLRTLSFVHMLGDIYLGIYDIFYLGWKFGFCLLTAYEELRRSSQEDIRVDGG